MRKGLDKAPFFQHFYSIFFSILQEEQETSMKNLLRNTTAIARAVCQSYIDEFRRDPAETEPLIAVDATCGNGHDTLWLAESCDKVYGFDIQESAVSQTAALLEERGLADKVRLFCDNHANMMKYIREETAVIVFNLGYLPSGDKNITTDAKTTLSALSSSLSLLRADGLLCVTMYPGHPAGKTERKAALAWAAQLDKRAYHCVRTDMLNQPDSAPEILFITTK